jgi:hypothetical protein
MFTTILSALLLAAAPQPADEARHLSYRSVIEADSLRVARAVAEAERFATLGRFAEAKRRYRDAIREDRAQDRYPAAAMWGLATVAYGEGNEREAARVLDELAGVAESFADPVMELRARFEAAVLYARQGLREQSAGHLIRVKRLLQSPAIPDDQKRSIQARLGA